jgi:hypothetical protein
VPSLAGRLREAEYESLGMLSATLTLRLFQVCTSFARNRGQRHGHGEITDSLNLLKS